MTTSQPLESRRIAGWILLFAVSFTSCRSSASGDASPTPGVPTSRPEAFTVNLPGTDVSIEMLPVENAGRTYWLSSTEVPWEAYDVFLYEKEAPRVDAVSRPSAPYISVDRGFGYRGYPAISMSLAGARAFCEWLSKSTGRAFRIPERDELRAAGGANERGWSAANSGGKTHPIASLDANALGFHDLAGNVAEWCLEDGRAGVAGGCFQDPPNTLDRDAIRWATPRWNASDPQIPKSTWWLADAPFVGFRILCERP